MAENSSIPGVRRSTVHGMVTPTNTAYRIYQYHASMTSTATAGATLTYLCDATQNVTTTASAGCTIYVTVGYDSASPVGICNWESSDGVLFPNGLFIQTPSNLVYYTLVYETVYGLM